MIRLWPGNRWPGSKMLPKGASVPVKGITVPVRGIPDAVLETGNNNNLKGANNKGLGGHASSRCLPTV